MNRRILIDDVLEQDINRLMVCAPMQCPRQMACFRVARFARDKIREMHVAEARLADELDCEQFAAPRLYQATGSWEAA